MSRPLKDNFVEDEISEGDYRYLASEIIQYNDNTTLPVPDLRKADVFALGMTAFELIRGLEFDKDEDAMNDLK